MTRYTFLAILLLSTVNLDAQSFLQLMYPALPFDTINFEHDFTTQELIPAADGGLILLGNDEHTGYICKLNTAGVQIWAQRLSLPENSSGDTVQVFLMRGLELSNGDLLISMRTGGDILAPPVLALAQFSSAGALLWSRRFPGYSVLVEAMVEANGQILMIGNENFGGQNVATVLELDDQGAIIDGRRCIFPFWFTSLSMDGAIYQDNKFLFWDSFFEGTGGPNQNNFSTIITEYDFSSGTFSHIYQTESLTSSIFAQRIIYDIVLDTDGSRFICYQKDGNFLLSSFNSFGNEAWTMDIGSPGHLLLSEGSVFVLGSADSPDVAAFKRFDKSDGAFRGARAYPGFSTSFVIGDPILVDGQQVYWPAIAQDPTFDPLPITPICLVNTDTLGLIDSCEPLEVCEDNIFATEPSGFAPFGDLPEEAAPQPPSAAVGLLSEAVNFVIMPFCVPSGEEELSADFELHSPFCTGDSIIIFPSEIDPALSTSEWTSTMSQPGFSDQDTALLQFFTSGFFDIQHILEVEGCRDTVIKSIEILEGPVFDLGPDTSFCANSNLLLQSGLSATDNELLWQDGSRMPALLINTPGSYRLEATNALGCTFTDQISVTEAPLPSFSLGMDTIICKGSSIPLRPDIVPLEASFLWSTGASNPEIIVSETNAYTLSITDESTHCVATDTIMVSVRPFPDFTYRPTDTVFCPGSTLVLEALSLAQAELDFSWPDGSTGDEYTVPAAGNIVLLASDGPCQDTLMFNIPPGDCLAPVYAPTAFSPNDDGRNDLFRLLGPNIQIKQFRIFDRWGSLLYQSEDATAAWDGHTAGAPANPGLYLYQVVYLNERSLQMEERSGEIILIR